MSFQRGKLYTCAPENMHLFHILFKKSCVHAALSQLIPCSQRSCTNLLSRAALTKKFSTEMSFLITQPKIFRRFKCFQWKSFVVQTPPLLPETQRKYLVQTRKWFKFLFKESIGNVSFIICLLVRKGDAAFDLSLTP